MKMIKLGGREEYLSLALIQRVGLRQAEDTWEAYVVIDSYEEILYKGEKDIAEKVYKILLSHVCDDKILDINKSVEILIRKKQIDEETSKAINNQLKADQEWEEIYINKGKTRFHAVRVVKMPHFDRVLYEIKTSIPKMSEDGKIIPSRWFSPLFGRKAKPTRYESLEDAVQALRLKAAMQGWVLVKIPTQSGAESNEKQT